MRVIEMDHCALDASFPFHASRGVLRMPSFAVHAHRFREIAVIFGGRALHVWGRRRTPTAAGDVFLLGKKPGHGFAEVERLDLANVMFVPGALDLPHAVLRELGLAGWLYEEEGDAGRSKIAIRLAQDELAEAEQLVERMSRERYLQGPGCRAAITGQLVSFLVLLDRAARRGRPASPERRKRLAAVLQAMEKEPARAWTLEELAAQAHLSVNQFLRVFRAEAGTTPMRYLTRLRLREAARLLADPGRTVTAVAHAVGYDDSNYFARQFRRGMGVSASAYRRRVYGMDGE